MATGRLDLVEEVFGGVAVILAGDFGQLPPVAISPSLSLLCSNVLRDTREQKAANRGLRLLRTFETVVRLRRIHRQPGVSPYKESLIRTRDGAMTKEDHESWREHNLNDIDVCTLSAEDRARFENRMPHLFAENAAAGCRNGFKAGQHASETGASVLRVTSGDSSAAASRQPHDQYGQLRRVVHLVRGAPMMLIANLRTSVGLVNGAMGDLVAVELRDGASSGAQELRNAVSVADVRYAIVDFPKYEGPVFFADHPTWVPVRPLRVRHKRVKQWQRLQLPLALAWGSTIHKSPGLTFSEGVVVDFAHQPTYQPVAQVGLAYVAMSRCTSWSSQAFRNLPSFWEFRKVLREPLFRWRAAFEERMGALHDATMERFKSAAWTVDDDVQARSDWSSRRTGRELTEAEVADLRGMLAVRGVLPAPEYDDEPHLGPRGLQGGGGRKHKMGMRAPAAKRLRRGASDDEHDEEPADVPPSGPLPEPSQSCGRSLAQEMAGNTSTGWFCALANRRLGSQMSAPAWFMRAETGASLAGVQRSATCGLHAVNHAAHALVAQQPITWDEFDGRARGDERRPSGDWEYAALQRNVEAIGAGMQPVQTDGYQELARWLSDATAPHISLWGSDVLGCVMHVPGHWVALTRPEGPSTERCAALLCDSLMPHPYALSVEDIGKLFALVAVGHQCSASEQSAAEWSLYLVQRSSGANRPRVSLGAPDDESIEEGRSTLGTTSALGTTFSE